jgi:hypothetical protein
MQLDTGWLQHTLQLLAATTAAGGSTGGSLKAVHLGPAARLLGSVLQLAALCRQADNTQQTDSYIKPMNPEA